MSKDYKSLRLTLFVLWMIKSLNAVAQTELLSKEIPGLNKAYLVSVVSKPSKPNGNGQGHCGSGEEITLSLRDSKTKKIVFSKVIESCLQNIELKDGMFGSETSEALSRAIKFGATQIEILWSSIEGKARVTGIIELSHKTPKYIERTN